MLGRVRMPLRAYRLPDPPACGGLPTLTFAALLPKDPSEGSSIAMDRTQPSHSCARPAVALDGGTVRHPAGMQAAEA